MKRYDLIVVGGGTAGLVSAAGAASLGARVALSERDRLGGDCLYRGCVPTKTLVKSARVAHLMGRSEEYGIKSSGHEVDFPAVMDRMDQVIRSAREHDDPARFREMGIDVFLGEEASFVSPQEVSVDGRRLGARSVILATGSHSGDVARRDLLREVSPMYAVARLASLFRPLPPLARGVAAMATVMAGLTVLGVGLCRLLPR